MYTDKMFQELTPNDRLDALRNNSYKEDKEIVKRIFSPDEMRNLKEDIASKSVAIDGKETELKEVSAPIKEEIKTLKGDNKQLIKMARKGYSEGEETVFYFDDQDNNRMYVYDADGTLLYDRKLSPSERQTTIRQINKTA